jgi:Flp pilus assembly pilin Flp
MAGKKIPVETVLTGRDAGVKAVWEQAAQAAEHYGKVVGYATGAFNAFQKLATGGLVFAAGAGFVETFKSIVKVGSEAEKISQGLAGSFQVYGFTNSFAGGMTLATKQVAEFKKEAAALPGTTADFIQSFNINFPKQIQAGVKSIDEARKRSNNLTAVLLAKGVDSGQIGRDLGMMLSGHAGADVRSFTELQGQLGVKNAEEFNKKSAKERMKLLDKVIDKNKEVIAAFGNTWEAVSSTTESFIKDMTIAGTSPLFEEAKKNLKAMNDYIEPMMPKIERMLTTSAAVGLHMFGRTVTPQDYATEAITRQNAGFGGYEATPTTLSQLGSVAGSLMAVFQSLTEMVNSAISFSLGPIFGLLPGLTAVLDIAVYGFKMTMVTVFHGVKWIFDALGPPLTKLMQFASTTLTLGVDLFVIAFSYARKAVDSMVEAFNWVGKKIHNAFDWIASKLHLSSGGQYGPETPGLLDLISDMAQQGRKRLGIGGVGGEYESYLRRREEEQKRADEKRARDEFRAAYIAGKKKGASVNQDFRGSKFSIEQKFAQGFDPGRVLTAVREDSARLAQRRLSAGNTPLFGGG